MLPPLNVKSDTNPPLPFSMKIPTCVALLPLVALGMLKTRFCREHACDTYQWMAVGTSGWSLSSVARGISVMSKTKLRICRKNWFC